VRPPSSRPRSGAVEPCKVEFFHEMSVRRVAESPRVTKPYTDAQWETILACGHAIDADFAAGDVRLTDAPPGNPCPAFQRPPSA
jgi:hypothetical protein